MSGSALEGAVVDLDGTVYRGDRPVAGAREGIERLRESDLDPVFLTNNPTGTRSGYRDRLRSLGIDAATDEIVTAAWIAADYLATAHPDDSALVVGESALVEELRQAGVDVTSDPDRATVVLASMDRSLEYADIRAALEAFEGESDPRFYATNPDRTCPTETGEIPDTAATVGAIEGTTGRELDGVLGKPSRFAVEAAVRRLGTTPERCLVVGDRLETDVEMGLSAGMTTVLVLSGVTDRDAVSASTIEPDYVLDSLGDIGSVLQP
ncbi:L-arabinose operon protein AraL [Natronococcus amylolyticus DSM 10524]|uniref:L-arabinose operon protein AraL n=1 Tax=Natronococcus amylolyticus DSM 10524 TaxID=1227497 RepID=L9X1L3_9EURY|nr:HAD-IIA family hydrolase [Natronococcus amylolyticus]ELY55361.1 L-arabinose operon protein AraL [Natronococcus amylolyticus DSM 10524]